jgi:hypothetical protein
MPGINTLGQIHRPLHVGEEYSHLLSLALQGGARSQDLLGEVLRGVRARLALRRLLRGTGKRLPAFATKSLARPILGAARAAGKSQLRAALGAEFPALPILATAG